MARDESSPTVPAPELDGTGLRVAVVCGRFNARITERLLGGTQQRLAELGVDDADRHVCWVPGAYEVPLAAQRWAESDRVDAVIGLGAVIRGETGHYDFVAGECARGLQDVQLATGIPVVFGVLTTDTLDQALARSDPDGDNKGVDAAETAVEMATLLRIIDPR